MSRLQKGVTKVLAVVGDKVPLKASTFVANVGGKNV
jgi:hypothetical protein